MFRDFCPDKIWRASTDHQKPHEDSYRIALRSVDRSEHESANPVAFDQADRSTTTALD
jgi:hypothetical protein